MRNTSHLPCLHTAFLGDTALWKQKRGIEKHKLSCAPPTLGIDVTCHFPLHFVNQVPCHL